MLENESQYQVNLTGYLSYLEALLRDLNTLQREDPTYEMYAGALYAAQLNTYQLVQNINTIKMDRGQ